MAHRFNPSLDSGASYYQVPRQQGSTANLTDNQHTYPASTGYPGGRAGMARSAPRPWYKGPWVRIGVPALLLAIVIAAVVGGVEGSKSNSKTGTTSSSANAINNAAAGSRAAESIDGKSVFNSRFMSMLHSKPSASQIRFCGKNTHTAFIFCRKW